MICFISYILHANTLFQIFRETVLYNVKHYITLYYIIIYNKTFDIIHISFSRRAISKQLTLALPAMFEATTLQELRSTQITFPNNI